MMPAQQTAEAIQRFILPVAESAPATIRGMSSGKGNPRPQAKRSPNNTRYPPASTRFSIVSKMRPRTSMCASLPV